MGRCNIKMIHGDCMDLMHNAPDNYYELAIVDPPYGVEKITGKEFSHGRGKLKNRSFNQGNKKINIWDKPPTKEYFNELYRTSKNQIIWGGNYFNLVPHRCPIIWDKCQPWNNFSKVEIAWSSFNKPSNIFKFDNRTGKKIHPTQKPVALYKWLLTNYAKEGDKILDTHGGSGSICLACWDLKFDLDWIELDKDYYAAAVKRFNNYKAQGLLF
jgi:site-specific DNA-methyltransferase (adenine-specific)